MSNADEKFETKIYKFDLQTELKVNIWIYSDKLDNFVDDKCY